MIPEGHHRARAVDGALGYTQAGNEQLAVSFQLLDGELQGQRITWYGYFTEKTTERTFESLEHCGWQGDDLSDLTGIDRNEVVLVIEHETGDDGVERARVRWVNAAAGIAMKDRMEPGDAKAFAQRMRGQLVARRAAKGQAPAATRQAQPRANAQPRREPPLRNSPAPESDDIPF